jgi:hypothetical protein
VACKFLLLSSLIQLKIMDLALKHQEIHLLVLTLNHVHVVLIFSFSQLIKPEGRFVRARKISSVLDVSVHFQFL